MMVSNDTLLLAFVEKLVGGKKQHLETARVFEIRSRTQSLASVLVVHNDAKPRLILTSESKTKQKPKGKQRGGGGRVEGCDQQCAGRER